MVFENDNQKQNTDRRQRATNPTPFSGLGKLPPQAIDLEEMVLGAVMLEKDAIGYIIDFLRPEMFYVDKHQRIFNVCLRLFSDGRPIDLALITAELRQLGELEMIGGA